MNLKEQVIIITGGTGSIGSALTAYFLEESAGVIVIDKDSARLKQLQESLPKVITRHCDLTDPEAVEKTINEIYEKYEVSVLFNNAGLIHSEMLINLMKTEDRKHSLEAWDTTVKASLYTTFYTTSCVADKMVEKKIKGVIINVSSIAAQGNAGQTAYSAAKAGIEAMTKTWSKELGMFGIRAACIAPGFFDTPSTAASISEAVAKRLTKNVPLGRFGTTEELAQSVKFIVENDYYNGQVLAIDGGLRI